VVTTVRPDLEPGNPFPDLRLPDHTGAPRSLSEIAAQHPLIVAFVRGWWCPKEQIRVRNLVAMQDELQREYGRIAVVTIDTPYVNGAFRAGLGADFPFLSD
jgi:peroxiredoxin